MDADEDDASSDTGTTQSSVPSTGTTPTAERPKSRQGDIWQCSFIIWAIKFFKWVSNEQVEALP